MNLIIVFLFLTISLTNSSNRAKFFRFITSHYEKITLNYEERGKDILIQRVKMQSSCRGLKHFSINAN